jgi:hypothetical protein
MRMCRSIFWVWITSVCFASVVHAQEVPSSEPPIPPETAASLHAKPRTAPAPAAPPPSAAPAEDVKAEPVLPWPQPEPAPGEKSDYPSEPAPELGPEPPQPPAGAPPTTGTVATESSPLPAANKPERLYGLAALFGVGVTFDRTLGGVNPLGFGFGLRADYRFIPEFTLAARIMYYVGGSSELPTGGVEMHSWFMALEGSYVLDLNPILIQPGLALGIATRATRGVPAFTTLSGTAAISGNQDHTAVGLYLAPGVNVVVPLSVASPDLEMFFVGGDLRFDLVFGSGVSANLQVLAQVGLRF